MWKFFIITVCVMITVLFSGCKQNKIMISGKIENCDNRYCVLMQILPEEAVVVDTILLFNGKFSARIKSDDVGVYLLKFSDDDFISFIAMPKDELVFSGNINNLTQTCEVKGNEESELLLETNRKLNNLYKDIEPLSKEFVNHTYSDDFDSINKILDSSYNVLVEKHRQYLVDFIVSNPDKLVSLFAFYQGVGYHTFFSVNEDRDLLEMIYSGISKKYPNSIHVNYLREKLKGEDD